MALKLEGSSNPYTPKDTDPVECKIHGVRTTWGALSPIQRLAVEEGIDTTDDMQCILEPRP